MGAFDEARLLLGAAGRDLRALEGMSDTEVFADEVFGFHAQQAVEKALKAWLSLLGVEYPRTHDLSFLLSLLESHGQDVVRYLDFVELNPFAVQYRYDAYEEFGVSLDREVILKQVEELVSAVRPSVNERLP